MRTTATDRTISIAIGRKTSKDYNSTEVRLELTLDLDPGDDTATLIQTTTMRLKEQIREAFRSLSERS